MSFILKLISFKPLKGRWLALAVYFIVSALVPAAYSKNTLKDFTSDGCSMSPDGFAWDVNAYLDCCIDHDIAYWQGGTRDDREHADQELRKCVEVSSNKYMADAYYRGVRVGGTNKLQTPFRWGYGWTEERGYKPLSREDRQQIKAKAAEIDWEEIYNSIFLGNKR